MFGSKRYFSECFCPINQCLCGEKNICHHKILLHLFPLTFRPLFLEITLDSDLSLKTRMLCFEHFPVGFLLGLNYVGSVCFGFFAFFQCKICRNASGMGTTEQCTDSSHSLPVKYQSWYLSTPFPPDSMSTFLYPQLLRFSNDHALSRA